jgi:hypothetical protein
MRGSHDEDPMGEQMAAMSQTLADSTAKYTFIFTVVGVVLFVAAVFLFIF